MNSERCLIFFHIQYLKSVLELVSFTDFFLAQSEKEAPQRKKVAVADCAERPKEAPAWALQQLLEARGVVL